jgi:hypothetical protein
MTSFYPLPSDLSVLPPTNIASAPEYILVNSEFWRQLDEHPYSLAR